ncbi:M61 family metallopeptidase [Aquirufa rosea]|uniref:M61 family peptidase n=1 Tax=Aquirufa rosea TaxID=2509241 RepID=A0A4Q1BZC9_9BACT|nr:M61 family metallopeptidase [Aquirufa rosea]RXK48887.1 M61 family peptidase [Aquirufa rosea]
MAGFTRSDGLMKQRNSYRISRSAKNDSFLQIVFRFQVVNPGDLCLQLPIWRPGRYQAQHFSKNIPQIKAFAESGKELTLRKKGTSAWEMYVDEAQEIEIRYSYYAQQADAGGSVSSAEMLYINFINCLIYVHGEELKPCEVKVDLPESWQVATSLKEVNLGCWESSNYWELVDSVFLAGESISIHSWREGEYEFSAEGMGLSGLFHERILGAYQKIVAYQLSWMGHFPVKKYRFLHWIKEEAYYHGVEHLHSTMMVLGPSNRDLYDDLIGLASHEFFHVWNIATIRPKELLPYRYDQEIYFTTAWFVEGVTTYLGDWFLVASGVYSSEEYLAALLGNLKLHFERDGEARQSLIESSIDLWLDGYGKAIPGKRVSIYYKGAIVALAIDLLIRKKFNHRRSIREVMLQMNQQFGIPQQGYELADVYAVVEEVYEGSLKEFWEIWVEGNEPLELPLNELLEFVGLQIEMSDRGLLLHHLQDELNDDARIWLQGAIN